MKTIIVLLSILLCNVVFATDDLVWETPIGRIGLPFHSTEILGGYDVKYNEGIGGGSLPVWTSPAEWLALQVGAVGVINTQSANFQPYVAIGHDFKEILPMLKDFDSWHLNVFGRWASDRGGSVPIGYGLSVSYSFATVPVSTPEPPKETQASPSVPVQNPTPSTTPLPSVQPTPEPTVQP